MPIGKIRHKGLRKLYEDDDVSGLPAEYVDKLRVILTTLEAATTIATVGRFPGWRVHPLKGKRKGQWAITVTGNWRIVFERKGDEFHILDFEDYH